MDLRRRTRNVRAIWAPSLPRRVGRRRSTWWALAATCAIVGGLQLRAELAEVTAARDSWGDTAVVLVVTADIERGEPVGASVAPRRLPVALIPEIALDEVARGALAKTDLHAGEVLLGSRVTGGSGRALPPGSAAITLQLAGRAALVRAGDLVDVWATDGTGVSSVRVAERLVVLDRSDDDLTVAVPDDQMARAAGAALRPVTVVLVG